MLVQRLNVNAVPSAVMEACVSATLRMLPCAKQKQTQNRSNDGLVDWMPTDASTSTCRLGNNLNTITYNVSYFNPSLVTAVLRQCPQKPTQFLVNERSSKGCSSKTFSMPGTMPQMIFVILSKVRKRMSKGETTFRHSQTQSFQHEHAHKIPW